jgi:hypothetical protein
VNFMDYVVEPEKRVPVAGKYDVVVAGASVSGVFAAMAAAENGAKTLIVDRFGIVGGNIGPGMICKGTLASGQPHPKAPYMSGTYPGFMGLAKEFIERHAANGGGCVPPYSECHFPRDSNIASYTILRMLVDRGVEFMLSAYASDPVMEGNGVVGLFVENKSGRQAVLADVTIDATGDADVARRAGVNTLYPRDEYHEVDGHSPSGVGMSFILGGIDWDAYEAYDGQHSSDPDDVSWAMEVLGDLKAERYSGSSILSFVRKAWDEGNFSRQEIDIGGRKLYTSIGFGRIAGENLAWGHASVERTQELDMGNAGHVSALESRLRLYIHESIQVYRKYMPGFEKAYVLVTAPFLGARGGPCMEGEYTLTMDDCRSVRKFDDVVYLYGEFRALRYTCEEGECRWAEVPYRIMVPKGIDGLLAVGRSASGKPDTLLRNRMAVKHMGQAGGTAAALCARNGVSPRELDVKELQRTLLDQGFYLGDVERLGELKLV